MLARHMNPESVKHNQVILTTLAHAFCHLIGCLNDTKSAVVQRTVHYLETIKSTALKVIYNHILYVLYSLYSWHVCLNHFYFGKLELYIKDATPLVMYC